MSTRRCPVCRNRVLPTTRGNVGAHTDRLGRDTCPMTGQAYDLTLISNR